MNTISKRDIQAFTKVKLEYTKGYDELTECMFQYMNSYMNGSRMESVMFLDEIENILGINRHEDVINFILNEEVDDDTWD